MTTAAAEYQTDQEHFWAGDFGEGYIERNPENFEFGGRAALFTKILARTEQVGSLLELGANIGNNLKVLHAIMPQLAMTAVEINVKAVGALRAWGKVEVCHQSLLEFFPVRQWDMTLVSGVLIHMKPEVLPQVYDRLYQTSRRYVCLVEYYNPFPVEVPYRGYDGKLYKRDFAGEMMDRFADLHLLDYGFVYHRDPNFPLNDLTWFLLEKR